MAKQRKRFYVAAINGGGYEILSLKYRPSPAILSYSHKAISGPFDTWDNACYGLFLATRGTALQGLDIAVKAMMLAARHLSRVTEQPLDLCLASIEGMTLPR